MNTSIEISKIETLPNKTLAILKDDLGNNDIYSLCLKDDILEFPTSLGFRIGFITINNIPICVFMIKFKDRIYKNLISFNFAQELHYLKNLLSFKTFNFFLFSNNKESLVYKIENKHHGTFSKAVDAVENNMPSSSYYDIISAKEQLLNSYTDEELWDLSK